MLQADLLDLSSVLVHLAERIRADLGRVSAGLQCMIMGCPISGRTFNSSPFGGVAEGAVLG